MIKKSVFEDDLIAGMQRELAGQDKARAMSNLTKAADCLHAAVEIFEEMGLTAKADQILNVMSKIAKDNDTKGLTSEKMVNNLKNHGTVFNMADDNASEDLLNLDIDDKALEVTEGDSFQKDFEDED